MGRRSTTPGAIDQAARRRSGVDALQACFEQLGLGIVSLDGRLRATHVNRVFRDLWQLSDADCQVRPTLPTILRRGQAKLRRLHPNADFDGAISTAITRAKAGDLSAVDIGLSDGQVLRLQTLELPSGMRLFACDRIAAAASRDSHQLEVLRNAIDNVDQGIVLVSSDLMVQFVNKKARSLWDLTDDECDRRIPIGEFITYVRMAGFYWVPEDELEAYLERRVGMIAAGDPTPLGIPVSDGRTIRANCTPLLGGGRMLTYTDVTDLVQRAQEQELWATTDGLTGLYNRRHFMRLAEEEWQRCRRYRRPLSALYFDIDNFKTINDSLGHDAGDHAIASVAAVCKRVKRVSDIVGRMGGDEFVAVLPEADEQAACGFANRLHNAIRSEAIKFEGASFRVTISLGVAQAEATFANLRQLFKLADERLYRAKSAGRDCMVWHDDA